MKDPALTRVFSHPGFSSDLKQQRLQYAVIRCPVESVKGKTKRTILLQVE